MQINKIGKFHNVRIKLDGFDIIWKHTTYPSERCTSHYERSLHYMLSKPLKDLIWKMKLLINSKKRISKEQCEGCGEGFAEWMIDEPNGEKYSIVCCNDCVGFYDWNMSRKRLTLTNEEEMSQ